MHEMAVSLALIEQVERIATENGARGVTVITVSIGPLSGVEADLLERAFPLAAAGTRTEGAKLQIEKTGVVVRCSQCGAETPAKANRLLCGECGDYRTNIVSGDEMLLQRVELDVAEPASLAI
jgi:hydrogenase nickel incorporation protein HypA/HybF